MTEDDSASDDAIARAFDGAPIAYVCVGTARGPHVTPQVVCFAAGRLWFLTAERSVKVRAVRSRPQVALTVWGEAGSALTVGAEARVLDIADPVGLTDDLVATVLGPLGLARYVVSNATEVLRTMWQAGTGQLDSLADRRVLVSCRPEQTTAFPAASGLSAVLGWGAVDAPVAVPGTWDDEASTMTLSDAARAAVDGGAPTAMAAVAVDRSTGAGVADRAGQLFRGRGRLADRAVHLEVERLTSWSGDSVTTVTVGGAENRR